MNSSNTHICISTSGNTVYSDHVTSLNRPLCRHRGMFPARLLARPTASTLLCNDAG